MLCSVILRMSVGISAFGVVLIVLSAPLSRDWAECLLNWTECSRFSHRLAREMRGGNATGTPPQLGAIGRWGLVRPPACGGLRGRALRSFRTLNPVKICRP